MKKIIFAVLLFFTISKANSQQKNERYEVDPKAKLIVSSLKFGKQEEVSGKLSSGETVSIRKHMSQLQIYVKSGNEKVFLSEVADKSNSKDLFETSFLELYEYDFNDDGKNELMILRSENDALTYLEVYRYGSGLSKKVGYFYVGPTITLENNLMTIYNGHMDYNTKFMYIENQFFTLKWHNAEGEPE